MTATTQAALTRALLFDLEERHERGLLTSAQYEHLQDEVARLELDAPSMPEIPGGPPLFVGGDEPEPPRKRGQKGVGLPIVPPAQVRVLRQHYGHTPEEAAAIIGVTAIGWQRYEGELGLPGDVTDYYQMRETFAALGRPWPLDELLQM
jgi:hypothetical protein